MPGIAQRINNNASSVNNVSHTSYQNPLMGNGALHSCYGGSSVSGNGFWSQHRDDVSYNQLQKFWSELTPQARQDLLRIDKQTLFEHARKNMYCSRCNGLLLEGFLQIVMYGKSLQQDAAGAPYNVRATDNKIDLELCTASGCQEDAQDPSVHPWGGLTTARDGTLTLLDCYLHSKALKGLQNVFDSARARERERELLYPDACGGGGRGWISQGVAGYGRGHGTRETCALHTARLSVETLVDFWSALGEETRLSLLRMKEEDFIERLMYRFDSKRFCRDCRRNVIREFKELKELKRMRRETRCTSWFCVADTAFQYEVSRDSVQADWHQTFSDAFGTFHHFEWAIGTGEGKSDILEFENVGLSGRVQVNGLDLSGLNACYITLRAWKMDGRCNELCVKAHALRGQQCVHCRLVVGDGFVTITRGESITRFFEHAEEAEEEEDDDSMDKDGNEFDGECSRPQKHAKSPELAREFLLDAATVIFKEQVEKAFREGTARQNAHSIFVCLALKLLEERVHVACKEIITLEKQMKLLEEEEKEKREEEERKERRRAKEREKKLRRKERLKEKESRDKKSAEPNLDPGVTDVSKEDSTPFCDEDANIVRSRDYVSEAGEDTPALLSTDVQDDQILADYTYSNTENPAEEGELGNTRDWNTSFPFDHFKYSRRKIKFRKDSQRDLNLKWSDRRKGAALSDNGVILSKYDSRYHADGFESTRSINALNKQVRTNAAKPDIRNGIKEKFQCTNNRIGERYGPDCYSCNNHQDFRSKPETHITRVVRDPKYISTKFDSPPSDVSKPYYRTNKYPQIESRSKSKTNSVSSPNTTKKVWEPLDSQKKCVRSNSDSDVTLRSRPKVEASESDQLPESCSTSSDEVTDISVQTNQEDNDVRERDNSDNCSSCHLESTSTSDSEVSSQNSEGRETQKCTENTITPSNGVPDDHSKSNCQDHAKSPGPPSPGTNSLHKEAVPYIGSQPQCLLPQYTVFQPPTMGYYHQNPVSWSTGHTNGLMSYPHSNHYMFANGYGYGLNGNARFMQYGGLQPLTPPLINHAHVPVFQPVSQVSTKEPAKVSQSGVQKVASTEQHLAAGPKANSGENTKPAAVAANKMDMGNSGFSLFHFGGPVALSTGFKADPISLKEETSPKSLATSPDGEKKDSIEEYNLFAATNGIKFSIF